MIRVFLDANVLFTAAHNPDGKAAFVISLAGREAWQAVSSGLAVEEARRNLARKFPARVVGLDSLLRNVALVPGAAFCKVPVPLPEKDQPILAAALAAGATHLLTGDRKHFGPHMNAPDRTGGVIIQTVAEFLRAISAE